MRLPHKWRRHGKFAWCEDCGAFEWRDEQERRCTAFPRLCVENSDKWLEVDEGWLNKWAVYLWDADLGQMGYRKKIIAMLREAGVRVKEEK